MKIDTNKIPIITLSCVLISVTCDSDFVSGICFSVIAASLILAYLPEKENEPEPVEKTPAEEEIELRMHQITKELKKEGGKLLRMMSERARNASKKSNANSMPVHHKEAEYCVKRIKELEAELKELENQNK